MKERVAQGRHVRGEGALAQEAHENRFYLLSEGAENSYWLKDSQGDKRSRWARKLSIKGNRRLFVNMYQGSKFKFEFESTCATRCKFLGALPKF